MKPPNPELSTLYLRHVGELRRQLTFRLSSPEDVEDLLQEVFLRAHRAYLQRPIEHPRAYLHRITNSTVADFFRRRRRRRSPPHDMEPFEEEAGQCDGAPTPEETLIGEQTFELLRDAIDRLPRQARQAIVLRKLEHLSNAEVAASMGITVKTVEKHLARGLMNLRACVDR